MLSELFEKWKINLISNDSSEGSNHKKLLNIDINISASSIRNKREITDMDIPVSSREQWHISRHGTLRI
nr:hypothetical protein [Mycoplasma haemofelis]